VKIAFVVHDYHRAGGHSRYVAELATRFAGEHEVHVFANRIETDPGSGIHFHRVPAWRANALTTVLSFALPITFQIDHGFDIVHSQGFCGFRGNVFTAHICNRAWHLALKRLEGGVTWRESLFNAVATTLEHALYRFARHAEVIAISNRVAEDLARYYHCTLPARVIYHGVDLKTFSAENRQQWRAAVRTQHALNPDEIVFLYVGDLRKGARRCILALSHLPQGQLMFVSRSPTEPYRRLAEQTRLASRVHFLGPTSQVEKFYAAADVLLHPTPYDAFGMVVSEAMASGLPVVVSREAGAAELVQHGVNGLLLNDLSSQQELAQHMLDLSQDRCFAAELGAAARKTVESHSWDGVAQQTMCVYRELLGERV
jgi:UDP-glucose:(heptosyl)LPS alpha-1,3-glucosyltransferase